MSETKLSSEELQVLRAVIAPIVVKSRTGELGILHGMGRFVSTQVILKKKDLDVLDSVAKKIGLGGGIKRTSA
jgi:F0F1-type ATP synthase epsilon subunit